MVASRHQCLVYEGAPSRHLPGLAALIVDRLQAGYRCLYLNSPTMVAGIRPYLTAAGLDVAKEVERRSLILSSDQSHLVNGDFDIDRMLAMLSDTVNDALREGYEGLWASGDMTWEFGGERNFPKLLEYEWRLEEFFRRQPALRGVCQYHVGTLPEDVARQGLHAHHTVYINETLTRVNPYYIPRGSWTPEHANVFGSQLREMLYRLAQA